MKLIKVRVILDTKDDIFRDIEITSENTFEDLHHAIVSSFGLDGQQMASFYESDNDWNQKTEIPLLDVIEGQEGVKAMPNVKIEEYLNKKHQRMLYVYDFLNIKAFYVEVLDSKDYVNNGVIYPRLVYTYGDAPDYLDGEFDQFEQDENKIGFDAYNEDDEFLDEFNDENFDNEDLEGLSYEDEDRY